MTTWEDANLHDPAALGGIAPMGAGPLGGTQWTTTLTPAGTWIDTNLHDPERLGGIEPMGSGPLGGTEWETSL